MIYRFDGVVVDPAAFSVLKDGAPVRIEPKALEVLIYLIERRDRVVPKGELLDAVWRGTAVTENALTRAIAQTRKALGDDSDAPRFIQTVPTKGYRFIAEENGAPATPTPPAAPPHRQRSLLVLAIVLLLLALLVSMSVVRRTRFRSPAKMPPPANVQLAARVFRPSERVQVFPTFAPDGSSIAYAADVDGTPHIFLSPVAGGAETQLTSGAEGETQPAWSPDGKWIAYTSARGRGIFLIPARGGPARRLTASGSRPAWSPDGTEIAFQTGEGIDLGWTAYEALPPSAISIVNVGSGAVSALTAPASPAGGHAAPAWRPDGGRIAFTSCDLERCALFTIARDGSGLRQVVDDGRRLMSPLFSSDGRSLRYVLARYNDSLLLSVALDRDGVLLRPEGRLRITDRGVLQHVAMTRDGSRFAWSHVEETSDLVSISAKGGERAALTHNSLARSTFPAFAPDGSKIAYCAVAAGVDSGVWIASPDGTNAKAVAVGPGLKQHTQWSRDGRDVLYAAWRDPGPALLATSIVDGQSSVAARLLRNASAPALSPDGRTVAFTWTDARATVVSLSRVDSWNPQPVTGSSDFARLPVWSRSGTMIAMQVRRRDGTSAVAVVPADGGAVRTLTAGGDSLPYSWSPQDREIAFAGRRDGVWNVWTVSVASGEQRQITRNTSTSTWVKTPAWSPDGKTIVYESGAPRANIWVSERTVAQLR